MVIRRDPISGMILSTNSTMDKIYFEHGLGRLEIPYTPENLTEAIHAFDVMSQRIARVVAAFLQQIEYLEEVR